MHVAKFLQMQYRFLILGHGSVIVTYILRSLLNTHLAPVNILCHRFCFPSNVSPPLTLLRQNSQCTCIQWPLAALSGFIILYPLHFTSFVLHLPSYFDIASYFLSSMHFIIVILSCYDYGLLLTHLYSSLVNSGSL